VCVPQVAKVRASSFSSFPQNLPPTLVTVSVYLALTYNPSTESTESIESIESIESKYPIAATLFPFPRPLLRLLWFVIYLCLSIILSHLARLGYHMSPVLFKFHCLVHCSADSAFLATSANVI
jgi:hypothetical protein